MNEEVVLQKVELASIPVKSIEFGERFRDAYEGLDELIASIQFKMDCGFERGIIQPLAVKIQDDVDSEYPYLLLAGGRRFSACVLANIEEVPCRIYPSSLSEIDRREIELVENVDRHNLTWDEKVNLTEQIHLLRTEQKGISFAGIGGTRTDLKDQPATVGHSMTDTAETIGKSNSTVSRDINLAQKMREHPELKEAKSETEARNLLRRLERKKSDNKRAIESLQRSDDANIKLQQKISQGYIKGDFFDLVKDLPDRSMGFIEVDPPYGIDLDSMRKRSMRGVEYATNHDSDFNYNEVEADEYPDFLTNVFKECYRVLSHSQWLICWYGYQWYDVLMDALVEAEFDPCPIPAFWMKNGPGQTNSPSSRLGSSVESFIYAKKGTPTIKTPGRNNIFNFSGVHASKKSHTTERPVEMLQEILETFTTRQTKVLVPFAGSGATLLAAANLDQQAIGFDLDNTGELKDSFVAKAMRTRPGTYTSYGEDA
jgi:site-specific DNA-methyltransferase (adenine-specific)